MNELYVQGFLGGMLIGLAAVILYGFNGRIMGVSGILSRLLQKPSLDSWWRLSFIVGLLVGGFLNPFPIEIKIDAAYSIVIVAGLLVGIGTVLGSGCTSGHGVCGIARLSKRSIVATFVFMAAGILTVYLKKIGGL